MKSTSTKIMRAMAMFAVAIALLGEAAKVQAATFTAASSGAWNLGATWGNAGNNTAGSGYPGSADTAVIATGKAVTGLGGASQACTTLTIQGTGTMTVDANTLTVSGVTTIGSSGAANLTIAPGAIFASTSTASGAYVFGGTSSSITNNGTFNCSGGNGAGGTTPIFQNNGTVTFTGSQQEFNSAVAFAQGTNAVLNLNSSSTTPFGGSSTLTASATGNTVTYGASGVNVKAVTYYNLTISTPSGNWTGGASTIAGTLTFGGSGSLGNLSGLTISGNLLMGGSGTITANASLVVGGNLAVSNGVVYAQYGINVTGTTTLGGGTLQLGNQSSGSATFTGDFNLSSGTFNSSFGGQNDTVNFGGNLTVSGGTFTAGTGAHTFSGTGKTITGTVSIPNVTVSGSCTNAGMLSATTALAGSGTLTQNTNSTLNIGGTSTLTTLAATANTPNTVAYTGSGAQTVKATPYYNLTMSGGNTKTLAAALTVSNTLTIAASTTLADGGFTLAASGNVSNSGTHTGAGQISLSGGSAAHSLSGTGAYQNLALNDANGAVIASGASTVNGTLTLTAGALSSGGGTLTMGNSAAISRAAGSLSSLTPTFGTSVNLIYNDVNPTTTGSELPASATVLSSLTISNAAGVTLNAGATLKGTLTLTNGQLITGANTLTVTSAGTISGGSSSSYVYGTLSRGFAIGSGKSAVFPVGDSSIYAPVSLASATVTVAGNLVVSTVNNENSQGAFASSGLNQGKYVQRDWTIITAGGYAESAGNLAFNFVAGDIQGGMSTTTDVVGKYSGSAWTHPNVTSRSATSITVNGITSFGDFVIAELPVPVFSGLSSRLTSYGTSSTSLGGNLSANSGSAFPVNGSLVSATINGHTFNGSVTNNAGDFTVNYADASLATDGVGGSPYSITYAFIGDVNLAPAANNSTTILTVNPASLSITANNDSKTYGQTKTYGAGPSGFTPGGLKNGETVGSVTLTASGGTAATDPVGTYTLVPSAATGGTFNPVNYNLAYNNGTLTVGPALLGVLAHDTNRVYGATNPVFTAAITGFVNSESLANSDVVGEVSLSTLAGTNSVVGAYTITAAIGTLASTNYTFSFTNGTLTINPATITVTADHLSRAYGAANPVLTYVYSGFTNGDDSSIISGTPVLSVSADTNAVVGDYTITTAGGTLSATNYSFILVNGTLSVTPAVLDITADDTNKVYGSTLGFAGTEFSALGLQNGETVGSVTLTAGTGTAATGAVGNYSIVPSAATGGTFTGSNYAITYDNGTLTVSPASLTVTANDASKVAGQRLMFVGTEFTESGLLNSDTVTNVTLTSSGAVASAPATSYSIVPDTAMGTGLGNYIIVYVNGTLTVTPSASTPVTLNAPVYLTDGTVQLTFTGGDSGVSYRVQGLNDLTTTNWADLATNVATTNGLPVFIDLNATNYTQRFYRTVTP